MPDSSLIVVDDGSSDDTQDILSRFPVDVAMRVPINSGLRNAFTMAVAKCNTEYFLRVDADILFTTPHSDRLLTEHMNKHPECGVCGATQLVKDGKLWSAGDSLWPSYRHIKEPVEGEYRKCDSVMGCFSCYRMSAWKDAGGLTAPRWIRCETEDLNLRIQQHDARHGCGKYECHCLPFTFEHHHWESCAKTGRYNDLRQQKHDIQEYMYNQHGVLFYGKPKSCAGR